MLVDVQKNIKLTSDYVLLLLLTLKLTYEIIYNFLKKLLVSSKKQDLFCRKEEWTGTIKKNLIKSVFIPLKTTFSLSYSTIGRLLNKVVTTAIP